MKQKHPLYQCRWVGGAPECASPVIRRRFSADIPLSASIAITGLGYFKASINGLPLSDHRFQPVCSEYGPRDLTALNYPLRDRLTFRIYYCTYDVTGLVREGQNTLEIQLGNGMYRQTERRAEGPTAYGDTLKTIYCLKLRYADREERICSDGSETWQESSIVYNQLFVGEIHDFGKTLCEEQPVQIYSDDPAILSPQTGIPDSVIRNIRPRMLWEKNGIRIYDVGENISGVVRLNANGAPGEKVKLQFAENLTYDGFLDFASTGSGYICASGVPQIQTDICICGTESVAFEPLFCWHAFRYFSVEGPGFDPEVVVIHADAALLADFDSDCEGMNFLFDAFVQTQLNNMHGSIPSDCPHRERLGYTGDGQITAAAAMMLFDCKDFYRKWMRDILDTQDAVTGHTQHTAPLGGGGGGPVGWGGAIAVVPYRYFKQYGDVSLLKESWDAICKWVGYIRTRMDGYLVVGEEKGGWCLGDWAALDRVEIPEAFVNTVLFIRYLDMLQEAAPLVDRQDDALEFGMLQAACRRAVTERYYDADTGSFCEGIQGADAYGLYAGLGDERTLANLVERYDALDHFDTGFIGTDVLMDVVLSHGAVELAYKLLCSEQCGSFLYMKRHGATTLWEHWDGTESHDHPMFGGCVRQLYEGFLGIRQAYGTGGYTDITVNPKLPEKMSYMSGTMPTPRGAIRVCVRRENGTLVKDIRYPENESLNC